MIYLSIFVKVSLGDLLACREDLAIQEKTSSANVRKHTKSKVNSVIIGRVGHWRLPTARLRFTLLSPLGAGSRRSTF